MSKPTTSVTPLPVGSVPVAGNTPVTAVEPIGGWPADEFTGMGGSFERDPITGKRSRVGHPTHLTDDAAAAAAE